MQHHGPDRAAAPWLTAAFDPIGLPALNAKAALLERQDHKYVVEAGALAATAGALRAHFDVLEIDGRRSFTYETCYFDDPGHRSFFDHHQGRRQRMKVRVRHYVDTDQYYLEVKLKDRRGATTKQRLRCTAAMFGQLDDQGLAFVQDCWQRLYGSPWQLPLRPVLQMRYQRSTLVAREGGERMTIDTGLQVPGLWAARTPYRMAANLCIVETKSARGRGLADAVLRRHHQHPTPGCSKYCVAMGATGAVERINRFLPALRKLRALPVPGAPVRAGLSPAPSPAGAAGPFRLPAHPARPALQPG